MGIGVSANKWLWQPSEQLRWPPDIEAPFLDQRLDAIVRRAFGAVTFKMSSWDRLAVILDRDQEKFVTALQEAVDGQGTADVEIADVHLLTLKGQLNAPENESSGWFSWLLMSPRVTITLDHNRQVINTTRINVPDGYRLQVPPVPSLEAMGLEAQLEAARESDREQENGYMLQLQQTYSVTHYRPPLGPISWESELVLLNVHMSSKRVVVAQIEAVMPSGTDAFATIVARSLGGQELASLKMNLEDATAEELLNALARPQYCNCAVRRLRLVFPNGTTVDSKSGSSRLAALFNAA